MQRRDRRLHEWYPEPKSGTIDREGLRRKRRRKRQTVAMEPSVIARLIKRVIGETESTNAECLDGFFRKWDEIPRLQLPGCISEHRQHFEPCP